MFFFNSSNISDASNEDFENSIDYVSSLLQNLPSKVDEKNNLSECIKRFRKDVKTTLNSSSKFQAIPGSENIPTR